MPVIPRNYEEWEHCITVECGIPLTPDFVDTRIEALENQDDFQTQKFLAQYGEAHLNRTLGWFRQAKERLAE